MPTFSKPKPAGTPTWTDLTTTDLDAARSFYHAIFGWEFDIGGPEFGGYTTARVGALPVAGIGGQMPGAPAQPAAWRMYFASDDAQADTARAVTLGAQVFAPAMSIGPFGSMAVLANPTGAPFGLWQAGQHIGWQMAAEYWAEAWLELYSPDAKKARDFYTSLTGLTTDLLPGGMEYYVLKRGEYMYGGIMQIDPSWANMTAMWVTYFSVKNTDEAVATAKKHGAKQMGNIEDSPFGRFAALTDPQGAVFKVVQPPKQ